MRRFYLGLCWVAACGSQPAPVAPAIDDVEPATAVEGTPTPVLIHGRGFYVRSEVDFGHGSLDVDSTFAASLGGTLLDDVARVDAQTLRATVPGTLKEGAYDLTVEVPGGARATRGSAFVVLAPSPDRLVVASAAGGGPELGEVVLPLGDSLTVYAAAYRDTRWRGDVEATWDVEGGIGSVSIEHGNAAVFTATALGSGLLRARTDDGLEATTGVITVRCAHDLDCDDGDACTIDSCDPILGCQADPVVCDDGNVCNGVESCVAGACVSGTALVCDDGDSCTADSCDEALGCVSVPLDTAGEGPVADPSCSDGVDNDCDGLTDLADPECENMPPIPSFEVHPPATSLYEDPQSVPPPGEIVDPVSQPPAVSLVEADVSATRDDVDPIDALGFSLDWGNGTTSSSTGLDVPLTTGYGTAGDYSAWLRVTDTAGLAAYAFFEVVVAPAGHLTRVTDGSDPGSLRTAITTTTKSAPYVVLVSDLAGAPITLALTSTLDIGIPVEIVGDRAIIDCSGLPAGADCLRVSADDVWIMGFEIRGTAGHPIRVNGARAKVARCRIEENATGVLWAGNGGTFGPDNEVVGTLGTGPALEIRAPVLVTRNRIHSNGGDGILVAAAPAGSAATIAQNWIWANLQSGIEIADAVAGTRVWLNTVDGNAAGGIAAGASSSGTDLRDNAVTNNGGAGVSAAGGPDSFATFDYNAYWGNAGGACVGTPACVLGAHDRQVDPFYAGPADFRPRPASPLRDAGVDVGVDVNGPVPGLFNGAAPDIGGWETP